MNNSEIKSIIFQLEVIYNGQPWYGDSIADTLKNISAADAVAEPAEGIHSILQIMEHMISWKKLIIEKLHYNKDFDIKVNSKDDWKDNTAFSESSWQQLQENFLDVHNELLKELEKKDDAFLQEQVPGRNYTFNFMLRGIAEHDVYHLGQIRLIMKLLSKQK